MHRHAQLVSDQVFAALVPVERGEPGLVRGACCGAVGELALAQRCESFHECVIKRKGPLPVA